MEDLKLATGLVVIPYPHHRLSYLKAVHPPPSPRPRMRQADPEYASLIHSPLGRRALAAMSGLKSTSSISKTPFVRSVVRSGVTIALCRVPLSIPFSIKCPSPSLSHSVRPSGIGRQCFVECESLKDGEWTNEFYGEAVASRGQEVDWLVTNH